MKHVFLSFVACLCSFGVVMAQTTLSGDHVVTGDLDVGATSAPGVLRVYGETGSTASPGIKAVGDGGIVFEGTYGVGQLPSTGLGTRFMWYPKKAAFSGGVQNSDDANFGSYSFSFGNGSYAKGAGSVSFGEGSTALGGMSFSAGSAAFASGDYSVAVGVGSYASTGGFAGGFLTSADYFAFSYGAANLALGQMSVALGDINTALGSCSVALGAQNTSYGSYSFSAGYKNNARARSSFVVGENNDAVGDPNNALASDPIFIVGNGTGLNGDPVNIRNRNGFLIRRNGNVEMTAKVKMPRQGDILMGEFGNPE